MRWDNFDATKGLSLVKKRYGNILVVPSVKEILFNIEYMDKNTLAHATGYDRSAKYIKHVISFNKNYVNDNIELYRKEIMPHELAHIICYINDVRNDAHGDMWKELCTVMGGSGEEKVSL